MQVVVGVVVVSAGVAVGVAGWLGWRGSLPRNRFVGVRTPATMASDEAFLVANRVAGPVLVAAGAVAVFGGLAVLGARSGVAFAVVLGVVALGVLGLTVAGGVLGSRAAAALSRPTPCGGCACGGGGCDR